MSAPAEQKLQNETIPFGIVAHPLAEMSQHEYNNAEECLNGELPVIDLRPPPGQQT